jgi:hypothetical protein
MTAKHSLALVTQRWQGHEYSEEKKSLQQEVGVLQHQIFKHQELLKGS